MEGDTQKDLVLTEARAMVVREYLVENFGFDDSQLKTLGMGKQTDAKLRHRLGHGADSHLSRGNRNSSQQTTASGYDIQSSPRQSSPRPSGASVYNCRNTQAAVALDETTESRNFSCGNLLANDQPWFFEKTE
jgi:hypothetical protein